MALFIGALAFADGPMLAIAKISVLVASLVAGLGGLVVGLKVLPHRQPADVSSATPDDVEKFTAY
jgi:Na+/H+ antiporter NhaA